jgi:SIR2-like domain
MVNHRPTEEARVSQPAVRNVERRAGEGRVVPDGNGHVFVIHGDLLKLACDAVLVPSDVSLMVERYWGRWSLDRALLPGLYGPEKRVTDPIDIDGQRVRYVNIGSLPDYADLNCLRAGIRAGLSAAVEDARTRPSAQHNRERPLLGMPVFGVGEGGYDRHRGGALAALLEEAQAAADAGLDVAIVCLHRSDYAALQSKRVRVAESELTQPLVDAADRLGLEARRGGVALFLGAGVSRAAGLPIWQELLTMLAPDALSESAEFQSCVSENPPGAATLLKTELGEQFDDRLRSALSKTSYALTHGLLASLRVEEVLTTNVDQLYEMAAEVPLAPGKLSVLPWKRMPGRPPWLLKMHGDLDFADFVFTKADYGNFKSEHGALGAVLQALLITRHLVFVGYSLRDENFIVLANEVASTLARSGAQHRLIGTILALADAGRDIQLQAPDSFDTLSVGDDDPEITNADGRRLEIFLDRMAWRAAEGEWSWILDNRYRHLLDEMDRGFAQRLKAMEIPPGDQWSDLRDLLAGYGMKPTGEMRDDPDRAGQMRRPRRTV